jgi:hypothetical protein
VIGHDEGGNAAHHHEDRREQRALDLEQQAMPVRKAPVPPKAVKVSRSQHIKRCNREPFLKIDEDCSHQQFGVSRA